MLDQLWTFISEQIHTNQFLVAGSFLGLISAIGYKFYSVPVRAFNWIKYQFIIDVDIPDRDEAFKWINDWLAAHPYGQRWARNLTVSTKRPDDDGPHSLSYQGEVLTRNTRPIITFSPSVGRHWFFYKGRVVTLYRERKDGAGDKGSSIEAMIGIRECFTIRVFTRNRKIVQELLEEARELAHPEGEQRIAILAAGQYGGGWNTRSTRRPRAVESIVLKAGVMELLVERCRKFLRSEQWYLDRGIPWRMGVLLKGPPGSGKSSAVLGLCSHLGLDIATLGLTGNHSGDTEVNNLLSSVPKNAVVLIEDIDCVFDSRDKNKNENKLTFSGLLNAIDGVAAGEGRIMFMTTNHPEKLDPALIRPGRVDLRVEIGWPDEDQVGRIFLRFYPEASAEQVDRFVGAVFGVGPVGSISMAAIQAHLSNYSDDAELAITNIADALVMQEQALLQVCPAALEPASQ
jgi:chaperone BCS1